MLETTPTLIPRPESEERVQRILLVEDDEAHAELIRLAFEDSNLPYRLTVAERLEEARRELEAWTPDLVIADLQLPDGRGIELLPSEESEPPFPIVVLTSHGTEQVAVEAMKAGALDYVVKSVEVLGNLPRVAERALREWRLIAERQRAQEERREIESRLQHSQKLESLGILAGGIAHDFNNLVMAIMGHVELANESLEPASPARENLHDIETVAVRASELCRQLLSYSGRDRFVVEPVDLDRLVAEMSRLLETAISKRATLELDLASDLPWIDASGAQIRQIVMNLITNASDALDGRRGTIRIRTGVLDGTSEPPSGLFLSEGLGTGRYVFVEVSDDGCGMDEATRDRLFDPFFTTKTGGRGLGMAAVKGIVRSHQGAISLDTVAGEGTTFRVFFPPSRKGRPTPPSPEPAKTPDSLPRGSNNGDPLALDERHEGAATVLVVDDDVTIRAVTTIALEGAGFLVLTAEDGGEGLETYEHHRDEIACILLDVSMPGLSGDDVLSRLRGEGSEVPVIASSGHGKREIAQRMPGIQAYIQKPYQAKQLISLVREVLGS